MRQDHGKHSWPWWKEKIISKWANYSQGFKMENFFEEAISNIERDRPMSWLLKQKDRLTALHPDMSERIVHKRILRKCGGYLEHAIRRRCIEPFSTEDYINAMEDITTRTKIGRNWYKPPMDNKTSGKPIPKPNKPHYKDPLKCHECGSTSHLANTFPKETRINEIEIEKDDTKEKNDVSVHESDSEPSEEEELPDELSIENINVSFEVTEVHTHLPQYSDECMDLIHVQDAKIEAKIHLDSGAFCTCVRKDYLDKTCTNRQDKLMPIEGIKFSSASQNMHPLVIFEAEMIFPHSTGSIRLKVEFLFMNNCTSQHFILGNDYLNIHGIDTNNHKDRYFTIGEDKRQKFACPPEKGEITVIRQVKNFNKEQFVSEQLFEAKISPELTPEMKEELVEILFQYREAFAYDNEPLVAIKGHEVDIILDVERLYPPLLRIPAYPATPRAREALESHINDLMKLGVLRKAGHNEEVEVKTPVIITCYNDKSRMVGDFRACNTYTIPDRYPIPGIHETLTQLSKSKFITSMDFLKGFHENV
ncbi:hypothetical protein O181_082268 [Austropuccinia psidii MF-1]|uniref:Reverse transcriptase domain-containing protein n=1 Tax=Austropuccinia psidii MF-1 TaxID=1389203 RepID=A0A9Q3FM48_9BASI|nr:hypothetical protein [Austropuccinia psidii MF-1]